MPKSNFGSSGNQVTFDSSALTADRTITFPDGDVDLGDVGAPATIPTGIIAMWSGLLSAIPSGWLLCDGTNGTPNLVNKFVKGVATSSTNPGGSGGAASASYTPAGTVSAIGATATSAVKIGTSGATGAAESHTHPAPTFTGTPATIPTEPVYYAIAFIMKS